MRSRNARTCRTSFYWARSRAMRAWSKPRQETRTIPNRGRSGSCVSRPIRDPRGPQGHARKAAPCHTLFAWRVLPRRRRSRPRCVRGGRGAFGDSRATMHSSRRGRSAACDGRSVASRRRPRRIRRCARSATRPAANSHGVRTRRRTATSPDLRARTRRAIVPSSARRHRHRQTQRPSHRHRMRSARRARAAPRALEEFEVRSRRGVGEQTAFQMMQAAKARLVQTLCSPT